jgi:hypothetical protein
VNKTGRAFDDLALTANTHARAVCEGPTGRRAQTHQQFFVLLSPGSSAPILHDLGKPLKAEEQRLDDFTLRQQSLSLTNQSPNGRLMIHHNMVGAVIDTFCSV